jgi:hypothetical protein
MDQSLVAGWIKLILQRRPGALLNLNSMLVLDSVWGHTVDKVKMMLENGETDLAIIPGGLTSLLPPLVLVLDSVWGHTVDQVKMMLKNGETDLAIIPGGLTSLLPPLDVCINQPLKATLKEMNGSWVADDKHEGTPLRKIKLLDIDRPAVHKHKGRVGTYYTWIVRKKFQKVAASQIALMVQKTVSFGTVMMTA